MVAGMRSAEEAQVGDTMCLERQLEEVEALPGFSQAKAMVFGGIFPADGSHFEELTSAVQRLTCNDASVSISKETSSALGMGFRWPLFDPFSNLGFKCKIFIPFSYTCFRCGFLGLLHMDVFHQRLEQVEL